MSEPHTDPTTLQGRGRLIADCINKMGPQQERGLLTTIFHDLACTPIGHRNNIRLFKTQVEPLAAGEFFTAKFYEHFDVISMVEKRPWKIVVDLFVCLVVFFF